MIIDFRRTVPFIGQGLDDRCLFRVVNYRLVMVTDGDRAAVSRDLNSARSFHVVLLARSLGVL